MYHPTKKPPPDSIDPALADHLEWMMEEMIALKDQVHNLEPDGIVPDKAEEGELKYGTTDWSSGKGLYLFDGTTWNKIS